MAPKHHHRPRELLGGRIQAYGKSELLKAVGAAKKARKSVVIIAVPGMTRGPGGWASNEKWLGVKQKEGCFTSMGVP